MRHFPHHIGDYAAATAHLSFVEDAAYHRLLRRYYQEEKPLPADIATVCRLVGARTKDERAAVEAVIAEFFYLDGDQWRQKRADREIEAYQGKAEAARNNGRKGGRPANPRQTGSVPDRNPQETQSVSRGIPSEKLTMNHEPRTINQGIHEAASGAVSPHAETDQAFAEYQGKAAVYGWPCSQFLNSTRRWALTERLRECGGLAGWSSALDAAGRADFLRTKDGRPQPWFDLDWMLKPEKFTRLMEGRYAERHHNDREERSLLAGLAGLAEAAR